MSGDDNGDNRDDNRELERFEDLLLSWMTTVIIFFIVGIALYRFTKFCVYSVVAFLLAIVLIVTFIVDYIVRRKELTSKGYNIRLSLDIMVASMIVGLGLVIGITWEVISELN